MSDLRFSDVHETDADAAEANLAASVRFDHHPTAAFDYHRHGVVWGVLSVEETRCTDRVRIQPDDQSGFTVGLPVQGPLHADNRGEELDLGTARAAVLSPPNDGVMATSDGFDVVLVHVRSGALEGALEALLGRSVPRPLPLPTSMALRTAAGRAWVGTVRLAADAVPDGTSALANPMTAAPLQDRLLVQFLLAADHPAREALDARVPTWGPRPVRSCLEYVEAHPERALTLAGLAARVGLSVRALEGGWLRHRDRPPWHDVARVRLGRAHDDLTAMEPSETTVADVAAAWGFRAQPFLAAYGARFGVPPWQTLRGSAFS
jgi:AraC-like DNA-binding protein